ncbi:MAG: type II secretion system protein GspD, partial [Methylocapsa sp.]|nr:type II secretion system protein GspD [Methylocapsa sp.]
AGGAGAGGGHALLQGVRIIADIVNNSVVVYANAEQWRIIERALNQLDRPQAQVAIDVTVAEVHLNNNLAYGVQFFLGSINTLNSFSNGVQAINTSPGAPPPPPTTQQGFNLIIGSKLTPHVVISALNQYTTTKILSNPSLVVIDNQVASLLVGQQVPVTTGNANILNAATSASNTVFNSIQYQDTGIVLHIHPRIYANGEVNLEIVQEISAVDQAAGNNNCSGGPCPTFDNRKVKSTVMVPDGQTVLLAGLIAEEHDKSRSGIPGLESIPIVGEAFTPSNTNVVDRRELIIFIHPQVIRDSVDASTVAEELRAKLKGDKIGTNHPPGAVTPYPLRLVQ